MYSLGECSDHRQKKVPVMLPGSQNPVESDHIRACSKIWLWCHTLQKIDPNSEACDYRELKPCDHITVYAFIPYSKALMPQEDYNYFLLRKYCLCQSRAKYTQMSVWPHLLFYLNSLPRTFERQPLGLQCILTKCVQRNKMYSPIKFHISKCVWCFLLDGLWRSTVQTSIETGYIQKMFFCFKYVFNCCLQWHT